MITISDSRLNMSALSINSIHIAIFRKKLRNKQFKIRLKESIKTNEKYEKLAIQIFILNKIKMLNIFNQF
jgi:hypothetical protein